MPKIIADANISLREKRKVQNYVGKNNLQKERMKTMILTSKESDLLKDMKDQADLQGADALPAV